jgi:ribonucleoside-diphosphate reductase alpha chain
MKSGLETLADLTFLRSYSKDGKENWSQAVERYLQFFRDKFPKLVHQINGYGVEIMEKRCTGSMRMMQFAGPAVAKENLRSFNCTFVSPTTFKDFADIMYLLACGCGVGSSTESHYVNMLPDLPRGEDLKEFRVPDDKEGWADSIVALLENRKVTFDYSRIRPAGAPLSSGGSASGPDPLRVAHELIRDVMADKSRLTSEDVADIICVIAQAIVSGAQRRSAIIILTDVYDKLMQNFKAGDWWVTKKHRAKANISSIAQRYTDEVEFALREQLNSPFGERGIILVDKRDYTENIGGNPCMEISLRNRGTCNLCEIIVPNCKTEVEFTDACRAAAFFGTLQASLTDFHYVSEEFAKTCAEDALLGVSMTGLAQAHPYLTSTVMSEGADVVVKVNRRVAHMIGINPAKRCTTIKPSGSTSCVFSTTSGIHAAYFEKGVRRVRVARLSSLGQSLVRRYGISGCKKVETEFGANYLPTDPYHFVVPEVFDEKDLVLQFPCHYKNAIYRSEEGAIALLERVKTVYNAWVLPGHNSGQESNSISLTVSFKPEEKEAIVAWALANQESFRALSTLPYDCTAYALRPFEELNDEEYERYLERFPDVDLAELGVSSEAATTSACSGSGCEVV